MQKLVPHDKDHKESEVDNQVELIKDKLLREARKSKAVESIIAKCWNSIYNQDVRARIGECRDLRNWVREELGGDKKV